MKKDNFLDYIPVQNPRFGWRLNEENLVVIDIQNNGIYNRLAQRFFHKPKVSHISLDAYGTFVFKQINGKKTVYEIAQSVKAQFGDEAEPLVERLVLFLRLLKNNSFIEYRK